MSGKQNQIMTVCGPVSSSDIGITLMHEHILADCSFSGDNPLKKFDEEDVAIQEMHDLKNAGAGTIVDCTCCGLSPDPEALLRIAQETGMNIVASTGFYRRVVYPEYVFKETAGELADRLIRDAAEGILGTAVKPGMLAEFASHDEGPPDEYVEKVWRAAGRAQCATGLPVTTHCWVGNGAEWEIAILREEGARLEKVVIGHLGANRPDMDLARRILDTGVNIGIDCVGYDQRDGWVDYFDRERAEFVKTCIDWGFIDQITISRDLMRKYHLQKYGGGGYAQLLRSFVPVMRDTGITETQIETLLHHNPKRILTPLS